MSDMQRAAIGDVVAYALGVFGLYLLRLGHRLWVAGDDAIGAVEFE